MPLTMGYLVSVLVLLLVRNVANGAVAFQWLFGFEGNTINNEAYNHHSTIRLTDTPNAKYGAFLQPLVTNAGLAELLSIDADPQVNAWQIETSRSFFLHAHRHHSDDHFQYIYPIAYESQRRSVAFTDDHMSIILSTERHQLHFAPGDVIIMLTPKHADDPLPPMSLVKAAIKELANAQSASDFKRWFSHRFSRQVVKGIMGRLARVSTAAPPPLRVATRQFCTSNEQLSPDPSTSLFDDTEGSGSRQIISDDMEQENSDEVLLSDGDPGEEYVPLEASPIRRNARYGREQYHRKNPLTVTSPSVDKSEIPSTSHGFEFNSD